MISTLLCSSTMNISDPLRHFASLYGRHNQLRPWVSSLRLPSSTSSSNGSCRCVDVSTENGKNRRPLTTTGVAAERVPIGRVSFAFAIFTLLSSKVSLQAAASSRRVYVTVCVCLSRSFFVRIAKKIRLLGF